MITEFELKYSENPPSIVHVEVERFDTLESMKETLMDDLNATRERVCGNYMGKQTLYSRSSLTGHAEDRPQSDRLSRVASYFYGNSFAGI